MGMKFNPIIFSGFDIKGSGGGGGSTQWKDPAANFATLPALGNSDGDVRGVLDTRKIYYWNGASWQEIPYSEAADSYKVEKITLTGTDITNKFVTLAETPASATKTRLTVIGGLEQDYSLDFTVSGSSLSWNGLTLDGILQSGDKLIITYS